MPFQLTCIPNILVAYRYSAVSTAARVYILVYVVNNARTFDFCSSIYSVNFLIGELEYRYYFYKNDAKFIYFTNMKTLYAHMIYIN